MNNFFRWPSWRSSPTPRLHRRPPVVIRGGDAIAKRSYSCGQTNFFRLLQHDAVPLEFWFRPEVALNAPPILVHEWLATGRAITAELPCTQHEGHYHLWLPTEQCGVHRFKIKYQIGRQWYWDRMPYAYYVVDPVTIPDLRIYTLIPTASGHMGEWRRDLPRLRTLGFNMIHLLPITTMDTSESPYAVRDHFAIDPAYVDPKDRATAWSQLDRFLSEARQMGFKLAVDLVINHVGIESPIVAHHPTWCAEDADEADGIRRSGWSDGRAWHKWHDLALLDYDLPDQRERTALWHYMTEYGLLWSRLAAKNEGMIRLDNLHSSHEGFTEHLLCAIRSEHPDLILFGEIFADPPVVERLVLKYGLHLILATPWEHKFLPELRGYIQDLHRADQKVRYYFPISSHDSGSPAQEFGDVISTLPRLVISTLLGPGPSGVTQGVEFGLEKRIDFIGRKGRLHLAHHAEIARLLTALNHLTSSSRSFHIPGNLRFIDGNHRAIIGAARLNDGGNVAYLIFANLDIYHAHQLAVDLTALPGLDTPCQFRDVLSGETVASHPPQLPVPLDPGDVWILEVLRARQDSNLRPQA
ncbi:MAG: hypothetical protein HYV02_01820 [Deltaproteobacteria bacterium]|nr:hypothetical protein [Deltaproteobacteria bacterium]